MNEPTFIVDAFRDDPDIQQVFQNEVFQGCRVPAPPVIVATRAIIRALEIVTHTLIHSHEYPIERPC